MPFVIKSKIRKISLGSTIYQEKLWRQNWYILYVVLVLFRKTVYVKKKKRCFTNCVSSFLSG